MLVRTLILASLILSSPILRDAARAEGTGAARPRPADGFFRQYLQWTQDRVHHKYGVPTEVEISGAGSISWRYRLPGETCFFTFVDDLVIDAGRRPAENYGEDDGPRDALEPVFLQDYRTVAARRGRPPAVGISANGCVTWGYADATLVFLHGRLQDVRAR